MFKSKAFARFARKAEVDDATLCDAVRDAERGLIAADLGGGVIKQRLARLGEGKSGGYRTLILFRLRERAFFVHAFAKSERDSIRRDELMGPRRLAAVVLAYSDRELVEALAAVRLQR